MPFMPEESSFLTKIHIAIKFGICYNASRQKRSEVLQAVRQQKAPVFQHRGFSIPNFGNGRA